MDSLHCDGDGVINRVVRCCVLRLLQALEGASLRATMYKLLFLTYLHSVPLVPQTTRTLRTLIHRQFQCSAKYRAESACRPGP